MVRETHEVHAPGSEPYPAKPGSLARRGGGEKQSTDLRVSGDARDSWDSRYHRALLILPVEAVLTVAALIVAWASRAGGLSQTAVIVAVVLLGIAMITTPLVLLRRRRQR